VTSSIPHFRDEYLRHLPSAENPVGGCPFDPAASALFAPEVIAAP
jgi:NADH-quinone oxidoreductase subunit F